VIQNPIVAFVPVFEAANDVIFCRPRLETKKRVRKIVLNDVVLRWEVVRFRLALLSDFPGKLLALMHVVRDRSKVVKKLAEDIPSSISRQPITAEQRITGNVDGVLQQKLLPVVEMNIAQTFVISSERSVGCLNRR